jgi:hypothetical protein
VTGQNLTSWTQRYLDLAVRGVRSDEVTGKFARYLEWFTDWLTTGLGHGRLSAVTAREVTAWRVRNNPRVCDAGSGVKMRSLTRCGSGPGSAGAPP